MIAEIISIGDELLTGQKVNTNARFICSAFAGAGIGVKRIVVCTDSEDAIAGQFADSLHRSDIVVVTGGLGPTRDDRTKQAAQRLLNRSLVFDQDVYARTVERYRKNGRKPSRYLKQNAMIIDGAVVIPNEKGLAPGMIIASTEKFSGHYLVLMPGVPLEMEAMMQETVVPFFSGKSGTVIVHSHIKATGIGETGLADIISEIEDRLPAGTSLAYLPHAAGVDLRVSSTGTNKRGVESDNRSVVDAITGAAEEFVYATADRSLEEEVGRLLLSRGLRIATAESCTGGLLSSRLTDVSGSSGYFSQGFVVYSNESKERNLGVRSATLESCGAVSEEVAGEMAEGCLVRSGADLAVSSTGIAGPDGGTETKPVGMVCLGLASRVEGGGVETQTTTFYTHGDRLRNKIRFSEAALRMVWKKLRDLPGPG